MGIRLCPLKIRTSIGSWFQRLFVPLYRQIFIIMGKAKKKESKEHKKPWREVYATVEDIQNFGSADFPGWQV